MRTAKQAQLETLKEQLRPRLQEYISRFRKVVPGKNISCINPGHSDKNPSMGFVPGNPELVHCFGCSLTADIFTAAQMLESKPLVGSGFVTENMFYLAQSFGLEVPAFELSEEEQREMDTYRAYTCASNIVKASYLTDLVRAKIENYGWSEAVMQALGVGSVYSYADYLDAMVNTYGFDMEFLLSIDLASEKGESKIFQPHNLIYTVSDEHGQPVGFAARNLLYDDLAAAAQVVEDKHGPDSPQAKEAWSGCPAKFVNTSAKCPIYQKGRRLYGLHVARKYAPPLWIFEGYGDAATAHHFGLRNSAAIGATAFTKEHLEMLLSLGLENLVFVLDGDAAGEKGTERFVKMVEEVIGSHIGLKVQIVVVPEGEDDPDRFLRTHGLEVFLTLPKIDIFAWKMHHSIQMGEEPDKVFESTVGLIVNEPHHLKQFRMAQALAKATGLAESLVWSEVERRRDLEGGKIKAEMVTIAEHTASALKKSPEKVLEILRDSEERVQRLSKTKNGYDTQSLIEYFDSITDKAEMTLDPSGLSTGYPLFDELFGGIPREEAFLTIPGKANHGKTSLLTNIAGRLVDKYDDLIILVHTIDDSLGKFWTRLLGARFGIPSRFFEAAGYHIKNKTLIRCKNGEFVEFGDLYHHCKKWLRDHMVSERLLPFDAALLPNTVDAVEWKASEIRKHYPNTTILVVGDNFHKYEVPGEGRESDIRQLSNRWKLLTTKCHLTALVTMELPKGVLSAGIRPRVINIKGSGGISYDSSANIGVYNDLKDMRGEAVLTWREYFDEPQEVMPGVMADHKDQPVLELVFDKSKLYKGFDGEIYYMFDPMSGELTECAASDQDRFRKKVAAAAQAKEDKKKTKGGWSGGGYTQHVSAAPMDSPFA